jgi:uncharacterized membrane protein YqiK
MELANLVLEGVGLGVLIWIAVRLGAIGKTVEILEKNYPLLGKRGKGKKAKKVV